MEKSKTGKKKRDWPVLLTTGIALLLLCAELISLGWRIFKPAEQTITTDTPSAMDAGISTTFGLFGAEPMMPAQAQAAAAAATDIKVYGIFSGKQKSASYALFLINGSQREVFGIGQEVTPGLQLETVGPDYVVLKGARGEQKLPLIEEKSGTASIGGIPPGGFARPASELAPKDTSPNSEKTPKKVDIFNNSNNVNNSNNAPASNKSAPPPAARPSSPSSSGNVPLSSSGPQYLEPYMQDNRG